MIGRRIAKFHAGAVSLSQHGILLPGPRRCGKSVLTLGLMLKGGRYLCEDVAVLDYRSLQLKPSGRGVSLRRDAIGLFPELVGRLTAIPPVDDDPYQQVAFASADQVGGGVSAPCGVSLIVFPVYAADGPCARLEPISPGQAVLRLLESGISLGAGVGRGLDIVIALVEKADAYILRYHDARDARDRIFQRASAGYPMASPPLRAEPEGA